MRQRAACCIAVLFLVLGYMHAALPQRQTAAESPPVAAHRALVNEYCVTCHNRTLNTGDLTLDNKDLARVGEHAPEWEKVVRKLRVGMMPPAGAPRPDATAVTAFTAWLENELD